MSRVIWKFGLVVCLSLGLAGTAFSQATDVECDGCVDSDDLATGAVRGYNIANGHIVSRHIKNGNLTTQKIRDEAITSEKIAVNAVGVSEVNPSQVQLRVSGSCPAGTAIASIAQDGSVICQYIESAGYTTYDNSGVTSATCPIGTALLSANCDCNDVNGTRNFGVLFMCQVAGNGGVAGCFPEAGTYRDYLGSPRATIVVMCLQGGTINGSSASSGAGVQKVVPNVEFEEPDEELKRAVGSVRISFSAYMERLQQTTR